MCLIEGNETVSNLLILVIVLGTLFFVLIIVSTALNDDLLLLVGSPLSMLADFLLFNAHCDRKNGLRVEQPESSDLLVTLPPSFFDRGRIIHAGGSLVLKGVRMLLSLSFRKLLILRLIDLFRALFSDLGHLLSHDLSEGIASTSRVRPLFRLGLVCGINALFLLLVMLLDLEVSDVRS